jgi:aspartate/methionine/tyrosine aminotransferase
MAAREYGPTAGIKPLREAVAKLYNEMHRKGKDSLYTWENVAIVPGGRAGLIRIAAVLGSAYLSFFLPDYTAYNEMLSLFKNVRFTSHTLPSINTGDSRHRRL